MMQHYNVVHLRVLANCCVWSLWSYTSQNTLCMILKYASKMVAWFYVQVSDVIMNIFLWYRPVVLGLGFL